MRSETLVRLCDELEDHMDAIALSHCTTTPMTYTDIHQALGRAIDEVSPGQDDLASVALDLGTYPGDDERPSAYWINLERVVEEALLDHGIRYANLYFSAEDPRFNGLRTVVVAVHPTRGISFRSFEAVMQPWH